MHMRGGLVCLALVAFAAFRPAIAGFQSGKSLLELCTRSDEPSAQACLAYIAGVANSLEGDRMVGRASQCLPPAVHLSQVRDVVITFLRGDQETKSMEATFLVTQAIVNAWCPVK